MISTSNAPDFEKSLMITVANCSCFSITNEELEWSILFVDKFDIEFRPWKCRFLFDNRQLLFSLIRSSRSGLAPRMNTDTTRSEFSQSSRWQTHIHLVEYRCRKLTFHWSLWEITSGRTLLSSVWQTHSDQSRLRYGSLCWKWSHSRESEIDGVRLIPAFRWLVGGIGGRWKLSCNDLYSFCIAVAEDEDKYWQNDQGEKHVFLRRSAFRLRLTTVTSRNPGDKTHLIGRWHSPQAESKWWVDCLWETCFEEGADHCI